MSCKLQGSKPFVRTGCLQKDYNASITMHACTRAMEHKVSLILTLASSAVATAFSGKASFTSANYMFLLEALNIVQRRCLLFILVWITFLLAMSCKHVRRSTLESSAIVLQRRIRLQFSSHLAQILDTAIPEAPPARPQMLEL